MVGGYLRPMLDADGWERIDAPDSGETEPGGYVLFYLDTVTEAEDEADLQRINVERVEEFLHSLNAAPPSAVVFLSSWRVYSPDAGEGVDESRPTFAWSEAGRTLALGELAAEKWGREQGVPVTVVRAAEMFGKGVSGEMARLFARVVNGHYVHIRGNEAKMSAVTAYDVAKAVLALVGQPGVYNVSDGRGHLWRDLCEAMTANAGAQKRMSTLPEKWAKTIYKFGRWIPAVEEMLSEKALRPVSLTCVLDNGKVRQATGLEFFDTLAVISRTDTSYPYED